MARFSGRRLVAASAPPMLYWFAGWRAGQDDRSFVRGRKIRGAFG